jgi:two-component system OmpR family response regulator
MSDDRSVTPPEPAPSIRPGVFRVPSEEQQRANARWRVLVAEDDSHLRQTLTEVLGLHGYSLDEAVDGDQTLARLGRGEVDIMVLDLHMPKRDGLEVLEAMGPPPPLVIVYSAFSLYRPEQLDEMGLRGRVFRVLQKPVSPAELLVAVSDAVAELDRQ